MQKNLQLDKWQEEVLDTEGNICLRSGRQVGKSTVISIKAGEYAVNNAKKSIMIISATERQAYLLFQKVLYYLDEFYKKEIKKGKDRPTKSEIRLKNGSIIRCLPTGLDGLGIRGYTVDLLIADEAAFIPEDVWPAITPMLATTGGHIILLSTPFGREGYFYSCFNDETFAKFHVNSEEVATNRAEPQRSWMLKHLESEKTRMTKVQYAQEYLGEFVDELLQYFPDYLIKKCMIMRRPAFIDKNAVYFLGVDVARMGGDQSTFEIFRQDGDTFTQVENIFFSRELTTETLDTILRLDKQYNFKRIYIDDGGLGAPIFDFLLRNLQTARKTVAINNAARALNRDATRKKKILKEDLYANMLSLMERNKVKFLDDDEVYLSMKSVQRIIDDEKKSMKIIGNNTHIVEGMNRGVWAATENIRRLWTFSQVDGARYY